MVVLTILPHLSIPPSLPPSAIYTPATYPTLPSPNTHTHTHTHTHSRGQLQALKDGEEARARDFVNLLNSYAQESVAGLAVQAPVIRKRLLQLVRGGGQAVCVCVCV